MEKIPQLRFPPPRCVELITEPFPHTVGRVTVLSHVLWALSFITFSSSWWEGIYPIVLNLANEMQEKVVHACSTRSIKCAGHLAFFLFSGIQIRKDLGTSNWMDPKVEMSPDSDLLCCWRNAVWPGSLALRIAWRINSKNGTLC